MPHLHNSFSIVEKGQAKTNIRGCVFTFAVTPASTKVAMRMALKLAQLAVCIGGNNKVGRMFHSMYHALSSHTELYVCLMAISLL